MNPKLSTKYAFLSRSQISLYPDVVDGIVFWTKNPTPMIDKPDVHIMYQKFCNALPLYRQEQDLKRMGIQISRQTMANWVIAGANLLKPLYEKMHEILLEESILHADETPLEVLCEPNRPAVTKSYMWLYRTGKHADTVLS